MMVGMGNQREVHPIMYVLGFLFISYLVYI